MKIFLIRAGIVNVITSIEFFNNDKTMEVTK